MNVMVEEVWDTGKELIFNSRFAACNRLLQALHEFSEEPESRFRCRFGERNGKTISEAKMKLEIYF